MSVKPATSAYLIRPREVAPGWALLYVMTFAIQAFCAPVRAAVSYWVLWLASKVLGETVPVPTLAWILGYGPLVLSLATLILPLSGWLWQQQTGGRTPSERERLIYDDALTVLTQADPRLRPPRRWFVLDEPQVNAAVYSDTLMVTRGLLESGYLEAVLAHELGHLNSSDARLTAALHRLTTPPRTRMRFPLRTVSFFLTGALGMWVMRVPWGAYWRAREFDADLYAARLGQGAALSRFLEQHALENDLPIPFIWFTDHTHPFTEHRIDRLVHHEG
jgi:Zn-dependent protease with chaperone function